MAYATDRQFGQGSGPIFISKVRCGGQETSLINCQYDYIHDVFCSHEDDAAVKCEGRIILATFIGIFSVHVHVHV